MESLDQWTTICQGCKLKCFADGKLATAKEIAEFSEAFVVSEELVNNYIDHFKHLSYCKNLRTQETAQTRRARASKSYGDYNLLKG